MQFGDERRTETARIAAKRRRILADLDQFILRFELLEKQAARATSERDSFRRRERDVSTRLNAASRNVKRLTQENQELKQKLTELRASARYRVGEKVTAPGRLMKRFAPKSKLVRARPSAEPTSARQSDRVSAPSPSQNQLERRNALLEKFGESPSKTTLHDVLSQEYLVLGNASMAAELISQNRDLLVELIPAEQRLVDAIEGMARLQGRFPELPPRQASPGFHVEAGRYLYCAHSVSPYNSNGYSTRTAGLVRGMKDAGIDVVVAARPGYPWDVKTDRPPLSASTYSQSIESVDHVFSHGPSWTQSPLDHYFQRAADAYVQSARRYRPERIHAASNHVTAYPALVAARRLGLPFTYEVRGLWEITEASSKPGWDQSERYAFARRMETFVALEADVVLAITEQVKAELISRGVDEHKIQVLPNAVDTDVFSDMPPHEPTRAKLGLDPTIPVIGYAGSLVEYEGLDVLLESLQILQQRGIPVQCVFVGDGPELPRLKELSASLGLDAVSFVGRVSAESIPNYVSVFDIMPCPRRALPVTEMVPPLKPFEAMAAAKAVVLSDLAPLRELAGRNEQRALLFTAGDPNALADKLASLLQGPERRLELGRRARLWVVAERTWYSVAKSAVEHNRTVSAPMKRAEGSMKLLRNMRIGVIADEFTYAGLAPECTLVAVSPGSWQSQLAEASIDALLVESAWEGNGGAWHRKVGYYDDELFADLEQLLSHCRGQGVPTIFWNKEDPVHFNRFEKTAQHFEYVFTSDDGSIQKYLATAGPYLRSVASLPFYAQPKLHNPLRGDRDYSHTVCYAGSYYGDRYRKRSAELEILLSAAVEKGLTIYDRQHNNADSPYKFPPALRNHVRGGLSYSEMVDVYKAHPVHVNVNSVDDSGTMLSRRVFEIAASGGAVLSGPGRAVEEIFGGIVPVASDATEAQDLIAYWMSDEAARNRDAWLVMRAVLRSHTAAHRLVYMLRTAGLRVSVPSLEDYAVVVDRLTPAVAAQLESQSHKPALVVVTGEEDYTGPGNIPVEKTSDWKSAVTAHGLNLAARMPQGGADRTYFEDLIAARWYSDWGSASIDDRSVQAGDPLAVLDPHPSESAVADVVALDELSTGRGHLTLRREINAPADTPHADNRPRAAKRILVAGHDLKFATKIIEDLSAAGHDVEVDHWQGHSQHDEEFSRLKLLNAEVIFCEWTLGNAVWYSHNKLPGQRLVCRLHLQELNTPYLPRIKLDAVDLFVFVGRHIMEQAVRDHGIPAARSIVIPNYVATESFVAEKNMEARWTLGLVGMVPQRKRLDLALDVLRSLRTTDERFTLRIKGRRPEEYPWMADRPAEMAYYSEQYRRIDDDPLLQGAVFFDDHGDDMPAWYRRVGTVLSVSDFESFHLTIADGAASGSVPACLAWSGADQIYPPSWLHASTEELADEVLAKTSTHDRWIREGQNARQFVRSEFAPEKVMTDLTRVLLP